MKFSKPRTWPAVPAYRFETASRVLRDRQEPLQLGPDFLLSKGERREAVRLLLRLERLPKATVNQDSDALRARVTDRLQRIASAALRRCVGLERFMVVRIRRDDGYSIACRIETVTLDTSPYSQMALQWRVEGKSLRKDLTIGSSYEDMNFSSARITRRLLNGRWMQTKLNFKARQENAFSSR